MNGAVEAFQTSRFMITRGLPGGLNASTRDYTRLHSLCQFRKAIVGLVWSDMWGKGNRECSS